MTVINVGYDSTNYYLVGGSPAWLLIDVGWPGTLPKLLNGLKRMSIQPEAIQYLLVTHYHPDHAGLAQEVKNRGTRLIVMESQPEFIPKLRKYMKPEQAYREISLADNLLLKFADSRSFLSKIGIEGEILSTPGHSDDSVTLAVDEGAAFSGDLPMPMMAGDDNRGLVEQSWEKIRAHAVKTIYPGHGPARPLPASWDQAWSGDAF